MDTRIMELEISYTDKRFLAMALKVSAKSTHPQHRMGAVVIKGGAVINTACNLASWESHAERRAVRPHMDMEGCTLYIVRKNLRCSAPCSACREALIEAGIKCIIYYNSNNEIQRENL